MVADEFILLQSLLQEIIPGNLILSTGWVLQIYFNSFTAQDDM